MPHLHRLRVPRRGMTTATRSKWCLAMAALALSARPAAAALREYHVSFESGEPEGSLDVTVSGCAYRSERGGDVLVMDRPGVSEIRGRFTLSEVPDKLYFRLDHTTSAAPQRPPPTYELEVNELPCSAVSFTSSAFISTAEDITTAVHGGENTFVLRLADVTETNHHVRSIDIVPIASLAEAVQQTRGSPAILRLILAVLGAIAIAFCGSALWRTVWSWFWGGRGTGAGAATLMTFILCGLAALVWFVICLGLAIMSIVWGIVAAVGVCIFMALLEKAVGEMR